MNISDSLNSGWNWAKTYWRELLIAALVLIVIALSATVGTSNKSGMANFTGASTALKYQTRDSGADDFDRKLEALGISADAVSGCGAARKAAIAKLKAAQEGSTPVDNSSVESQAIVPSAPKSTMANGRKSHLANKSDSELAEVARGNQ